MGSAHNLPIADCLLPIGLSCGRFNKAHMPIIAPSLLAADFLHLEDECKLINESSADWLHFDVMDGRFVPNISFGLPVLKAVRKACKKFCDVHLMIEEPEKYAEDFKAAGADMLTVHYEACRHLHRNIQQIKSLGMQAGVAINPHTPVTVLSEILADVDMVLVMSVNPGFGGQKFIEHSYEKISTLRRMIDEKGLPVKIEVDGGVTVENAGALVKAGVDVLVAGNTVFSSPNPAETIQKLKDVGR
jgi:ribulose-phosphate 3-epimerase